MNAIGKGTPDFRRPDLGKHIRGTYGFYRKSPVSDFEPGLVGGGGNDELNDAYLRLFARYADSDGGLQIAPNQWKETGMVILKPDVLERATSHVGHILDLFSSTGLHLVGAKLFSFSVAQAMDFYGFLRGVFSEKLSSQVDSVLREKLTGSLNFDPSDADYEVMTALLKRRYADTEVNAIVHYMTGIYPHASLTEAERRARGSARCLALLYHGDDAINTIRNKLGATNPGMAAVGTIRSDYGSDLMRNAAHASDSFESLEREREIIGLRRTRGERISDFSDPNYVPSDVANLITVWMEQVEQNAIWCPKR